MYAIILFILCLISVSKGITFGYPNIGPRIVNGDDAEIAEFPFQVSLQTYGFHFCGGSVLSALYVLTAAHCVEKINPQDVNIIAGTINRRIPLSMHKAIAFKVHYDYYPKSLINDIALIKIYPPFEFSYYVAPVDLPIPHEVFPNHTPVIVSGWGRLDTSNSSSPDILQKAEIYVTDQQYCQSIMKSVRQIVLKTNICANDFYLRRGQCNGDSGGPLTFGRKIIGIVSYSHKGPKKICASSEYPGVFTRVSEYIDWIVENATV